MEAHKFRQEQVLAHSNSLLFNMMCAILLHRVDDRFSRLLLLVK